MSGRTLSAPLLTIALLTGGCDPPRREPPRKPGPTATATAPAPPPRAPPPSPGPPAPAPAPAPPPPPAAARVLVDLAQALSRGALGRRGPLLDAGTAAMAGRYGGGRGIPAGINPVEHDGSTWA